MPLVKKQLGQLRPANTTAASIYSPAANTTTTVRTIIVCNQSGAAAKYRIFLDDNGTTYDETTALFWDVPIAADSSDVFDLVVEMNDSTGNLAVRTDTANALTFSVWGMEVT